MADEWKIPIHAPFFFDLGVLPILTTHHTPFAIQKSIKR
jgi:hypothetical protein